MDKEQKAIERIKLASQLSLQKYGKPLICTYSGGKDSDVLLELFKRSGVPFEAQAKAIKDEEKRLREKRVSAENGIERLKKRLFDSMNATGKKKLNAGVFTLSIQKNGGAMPVIIDADCVENMPKEMLKIDIKPDTKKIAELLQDEEKSRLYSKFAHFGERGESLRIR